MSQTIKPRMRAVEQLLQNAWTGAVGGWCLSGTSNPVRRCESSAGWVRFPFAPVIWFMDGSCNDLFERG